MKHNSVYYYIHTKNFRIAKWSDGSWSVSLFKRFFVINGPDNFFEEIKD